MRGFGAPAGRVVVGAIALLLLACFGGGDPSERRPDVYLITVDTLRADHLGAWGQSLPTSPRLDAFVDRGARFADATVQWPKTWPSMASLLTGAYPKTTGLRLEHQRLASEHHLLAEIFRENGYRTGAVVSNFNIGRTFGFDQGFDVFVESWEEAFKAEAPGSRFMNRAGRVKRYTNARIVTEQALRTIEELDGRGPLFVWVHYMDPHGPYRPPREYDHLFEGAFPEEPVPAAVIPTYQRHRLPETNAVDTDLGGYRTRYAREIRYLDDELGRLLDRIEQPRAGRPPPIVAFTADHGESLHEHGYHLEHGRFPYQSTAHVPLAVVQEGRVPANRDFDVPVGVIDLTPTLVELAGLEASADFEGRSLVRLMETGDPEAAPKHVFMEAGYEEETQLIIRSGRWKLIHVRASEDRREMSGAEFELYDLESDPGELNDVSAEHPEIVSSLSGRLAAWIGDEPSSLASEEVDLHELSPRDQEMLRALGYLE